MTDSDSRTAPSTHRRIDAIADAYVDEFARLEPVAATALGLTVDVADDSVGALTDYSPDGFAERNRHVRDTLGRLADAQPADERERVAKEAMTERLQLDADLYTAGIPQSQLSVIDSPLHEVREMFDLVDTGSEQAWRTIAAQLRGVPKALTQYQATLLEQAAAGRVTSERQVGAVIDQISGWTQPGVDVFANLVNGQAANSYPALRAELEEAAGLASAAVADFGRFLGERIASRARTVDAVGREHYELTSRYFLGAAIDLDETYMWGFDELARIERDMGEVARAITGSADVDAAVAALDADPARTLASKEAFRDWMQATSDAAVADLAGVHFDIPEPIRRLECCIAPTADGGVYYTGPSEDLRRPGQMWWSVPAGKDSFSTWREVTTVYHEGVPGHHLQVAQTAYRRELLNRWQRMLCFVSGHGEGWALYAERLMDDLGYLDDPGAKLGLLDSQGFRAARVVLDIGLHLQAEIPRDNPFGFHPGERWTPELGWEFLTAHSRMEPRLAGAGPVVQGR